MNKLAIVKIGNIIEKIVDNRGKTPKNNPNNGIPLLEVNALTETKKTPTYEVVRKYVDTETYNNAFRSGHPQKGDILIPTVGTIGNVCMADNRQCCIAQNVIGLRINKDLCVPEYLYYTLKNKTTQRRLLNLDIGGVQPSIKVPHLLNLEIFLPDFFTQKKIAYFLSSLDDKIELNTQINHNLLKEALTLYAAHFASQDKNGCIGDYCSVRSGFAFKSSWWVDKGVKVIKIGSISQDNLNLLECSHVDEDKIEKASDFKVGAGDLLIAMTGATIGKFTMVPHCSETLLVNQRVGKFFLGNNPVEKLPFIYCTLKQPDIYNEIVNRGQGSAQPNISAVDIMNIPCVIPSIDNLTTFNNTCQPLFDLIISNQRESQQLSEIRDSLLPKLMSGEIDVSEVEV